MAVRLAMVRALLVLSATLIFGPSPASADTVIGRWCDKMIPTSDKFNAVMAIVALSSGKLVMMQDFHDGSSLTSDLRESGGDIYWDDNSSHGDRYRIVPSTGDLQLIDNEGLIRTAKRLSNTPQPNDCLK